LGTTELTGVSKRKNCFKESKRDFFLHRNKNKIFGSVQNIWERTELIISTTHRGDVCIGIDVDLYTVISSWSLAQKDVKLRFSIQHQQITGFNYTGYIQPYGRTIVDDELERTWKSRPSFRPRPAVFMKPQT
jgi:hypothetical protein